MPETYLMPCTQCQASIEITPKFAGQMISCEACQKSIQAPGMREIRRLPLVDREARPTADVVLAAHLNLGCFLVDSYSPW